MSDPLISIRTLPTSSLLGLLVGDVAAEALAGRYFASCDAVQHALDAWRTVYNCERPHQAIDLLMSQLRKTKTNYEFLVQVSKTAPGTTNDND